MAHTLFASPISQMLATDFVLELPLLEALFNGFPVHNVPNSFEILCLAVLILEAMGQSTKVIRTGQQGKDLLVRVLPCIDTQKRLELTNDSILVL
jgi:hypothetical protein